MRNSQRLPPELRLYETGTSVRIPLPLSSHTQIAGNHPSEVWNDQLVRRKIGKTFLPSQVESLLRSYHLAGIP